MSDPLRVTAGAPTECPLCGQDAHALIGYADPADVAYLLERLPPPLLAKLAARLRTLKAENGSARIEVVFHVARGELQEIEPHWGETYRPITPR